MLSARPSSIKVGTTAPGKPVTQREKTEAQYDTSLRDGHAAERIVEIPMLDTENEGFAAHIE
jgi:hypothetical protein